MLKYDYDNAVITIAGHEFNVSKLLNMVLELLDKIFNKYLPDDLA